VPPYAAFGPEENELLAALRERIASLTSLLDELQFRKAVQELKALWVLGNIYLDRAAPWKTAKTDRDRAGATLAISINLIRIFAIAASPFMPDTGTRVLRAIGVDPDAVRWFDGDLADELTLAAPGQLLDDPGVLFKKVLPEDVAAWTLRFAGNEPART
jgi:methionyl-tRNA synthetase